MIFNFITDMSNQENSFECRECEDDLSIENLCEEHKQELQQVINSYPDIDSIMEDVDDNLILELIDSNNLDVIVDDTDLINITRAMKKYAEENLESEKEDFLDCGHADESFVEFFFYPFFNQDNFDLDKVVSEGFDYANKS